MHHRPAPAHISRQIYDPAVPMWRRRVLGISKTYSHPNIHTHSCTVTRQRDDDAQCNGRAHWFVEVCGGTSRASSRTAARFAAGDLILCSAKYCPLSPQLLVWLKRIFGVTHFQFIIQSERVAAAAYARINIYVLNLYMLCVIGVCVYVHLLAVSWTLSYTHTHVRMRRRTADQHKNQ